MHVADSVATVRGPAAKMNLGATKSPASRSAGSDLQHQSPSCTQSVARRNVGRVLVQHGRNDGRSKMNRSSPPKWQAARSIPAFARRRSTSRRPRRGSRRALSEHPRSRSWQGGRRTNVQKDPLHAHCRASYLTRQTLQPRRGPKKLRWKLGTRRVDERHHRYQGWGSVHRTGNVNITNVRGLALSMVRPGDPVEERRTSGMLPFVVRRRQTSACRSGKLVHWSNRRRGRHCS